MILTRIFRINAAIFAGMVSLKAGLKVCKDMDALTLLTIASFGVMMALAFYAFVGYLLKIIQTKV